MTVDRLTYFGKGRFSFCFALSKLTMTKYTFRSILLTTAGFTLLPLVTFCLIPLIVLSKCSSTVYYLYYTACFSTIQMTFGRPVRRVRAKLFEKFIHFGGVNISERTVLEIGPGYGENFKYYPKGTRLTTLEVNPVLKSIADHREAEHPNLKTVHSIVGNCERMVNVDDNSVDIVVGTQILCCIKNTQAALLEIKRILKPGGKFYFLEMTKFNRDNHWLRLIQTIFSPIWRIFVNGCRAGSINLDAMLKEAGFDKVNCENYIFNDLPIFFSQASFGCATKFTATSKKLK